MVFIVSDCALGFDTTKSIYNKHDKTGFNPSIFADRSKAELLLWIFFVIFHFYLYYAVVSVLSPAGKELTSWLSYVLRFVLFLSLSQLVFRVRCVTLGCIVS